VQAEALAPDDLAEEVETAIKAVIDLDVFEELLMVEREEREAAILRVGAIRFGVAESS
jgi:BMFP domain-containing protein YqiC